MIFSTKVKNGERYIETTYREDSIIMDQIRMIEYNNISSLLKMSIVYEEDFCRFRYKVTSLISLKEYLDKITASADAFEKVIRKFVREIKSIHKYFLLEYDNIVLEFDKLYFDPAQKKIQFIYIPIFNKKKQFNENLNHLLNKIINLYFHETQSELIFEIREIISHTCISVETLDRLLMNTCVKINPPIVEKELETSESISQQQETSEEYSNEKVNIKTKMLRLILINILLGIFFVGIDKYNVVDTAIVFIAFIVLDVFIISVVFDFLAKIRASFSSKKKEVAENHPSEDVSFSSSEDSIEEVKNIEESRRNETICIGNMVIDENQPYLEFKSEYLDEKIYLSRYPYVIGREKIMTDYIINRKEVSHRHLEIDKINHQFYIKDLNSTNGTYLNDKRLEGGKLYELRENDKIRIVNRDYYFKLD